MKFLADVNIDRRIIDRLRADGHDVLWVAEINRELDDIALLRLAWQEGAIILTNDKDFQREAPELWPHLASSWACQNAPRSADRAYSASYPYLSKSSLQPSYLHLSRPH